jgi:hypothetical protein
MIIYIKEANKIAKRLKLQSKLVVRFRNPTGKVPFLGKIAVFLLKRSGGFVDTQFFNQK